MSSRKFAGARERLGAFAPAYVEYSEKILFGDLWKRPGLTPRDRSLATIAVLIAAGNFQQLPFHLQYGLDNGLARQELVEAITHICFYAGWPRADTALELARDLFNAE